MLSAVLCLPQQMPPVSASYTYGETPKYLQGEGETDAVKTNGKSQTETSPGQTQGTENQELFHRGHQECDFGEGCQ